MEKNFLSNKYKNESSTPIAEVTKLANKYNDIINLSLGEPDFDTDEKIVSRALADAKKGFTHYSDPQGDPELRKEIIKFNKNEYNLEIGLNELMVVVGACHGMFLALEAILDKGDEVIIPAPYFTPYTQQVKLAEGKPVFLETKEKDHFNINVDKLKNRITENTKAVMINTPNNPTGACYSKNTLQKVARLAEKEDLVIIADDIYGSYSFEKPFYPIAALDGMKNRTITVSSFSKNYAMSGWRIGYIQAPKYIIECIRDINEGICFSAPTVSQRAAIYALRLRDEIQPSMINEFKSRVNYAYQRINNIKSMSVLPPQGTFYLLVNIKELGINSIEFSRKLLENSRVLVVPGVAFGESGEGYIRIACTVGKEKLEKAFDNIEKFLNK